MGTAASMEEFKELMRKPENIRNICTSAHIHHGKCISGDSRLILADGSIKSAKEIYELAEKVGKKFEEKEEHTIYDLSKNNLIIFSLNKETGKLEKKKIDLAWKLEGGKVIKVKLRNGFEIATTPEHKYIVLENMEFTEKQAHELRIDDQVVCAKNIDFFWKEKNVNRKEYDFITRTINGKSGQAFIQLTKNRYEDLVFVEVETISESYEDTVYDFTIPDNHNFVAEGMVIHNTALTDNLLAAAGLMSEAAAGSLDKGMATWQHKDEQERLMTVDAANVSMTHELAGKKFLINLIDTPGHVDFGGNVTRAMRAIDGTVVLVCGVEGIMPQTETVMKQALRERVKPVLFINKVDRMINELKLSPEQMQERFTKIIFSFNNLIERIAEPEFKEKWKVNIADGSVAFGSARENWGLSIPYMKKKGVNFKEIIEIYRSGKPENEVQEWVWKNAPVYEVILDMVIAHLPNPIEAQKYRIPHIWRGDLDSPLGKDLITCNPNGKPAFVITRITIDPKYGREMAAGRLFSGTVKEGMQVYLNLAKQNQRISQVFMYRGIKPEQIGEVVAGNVLALGGISGAAGETITLEPEHPFEEMKHIFEPVITKSIEPTKPQDLPKLVEILKKVAKEDPSIKVTINLETGENLIHGMGELHLEIVENRIKEERGFQVKTGEPIVVYRETVEKKSPEVEGKSPNKHNKFYLIVEPLEPEIYKAVKEGIISEGRVKKNDPKLYRELEKLGIPVKEGRKVRNIYNTNLLVDGTRGIVAIGEVQELVNEGFEQVMREGPLCREPCVGLKITLTDCKLHEDAIHRGPAQVLPAVRAAVKNAMLQAGATLYEPLQILQIEAVPEYIGEINRLVQNKRGQLIDMDQGENHLTIKAKLPVGEMFGFSNDLRSATSGRGSHFIVDQLFERIPRELQEKVVVKIRERKGIKAETVDDAQEG